MSLSGRIIFDVSDKFRSDLTDFEALSKLFRSYFEGSNSVYKPFEAIEAIFRLMAKTFD